MPPTSDQSGSDTLGWHAVTCGFWWGTDRAPGASTQSPSCLAHSLTHRTHPDAIAWSRDTL
jgi:hypothetical protein